MKFVVEINDKALLLTSEQLEVIADIVNDCEYIRKEYKKHPENGTYYYEHTLDRVEQEVMKVSVLPEARYNELKFFTAAKTAG